MRTIYDSNSKTKEIMFKISAPREIQREIRQSANLRWGWTGSCIFVELQSSTAELVSNSDLSGEYDEELKKFLENTFFPCVVICPTSASSFFDSDKPVFMSIDSDSFSKEQTKQLEGQMRSFLSSCSLADDVKRNWTDYKIYKYKDIRLVDQ